MQITFARPLVKDLDKIMEIENSGFSSEEASTRESMLERMQKIPDTFIVAYDERKNPLGYIVGPASDNRFITDDLFEKSVPNKLNSPYQTILSLVVAPKQQNLGIAGKLLDQFSELATQQKRKLITLTCLEYLIPFYEKHGYVVDGVSTSEHAGETWFNMTKIL